MTATLLPETGTRFQEIVDELTRRGFLGGALGTAALLGLSACDNGDATETAPKSRSRHVATVHGQVDVPADPRRIVAADFPEACTLLDLGVRLVGRPSYMPAFPAYAKALAGVPTIDDAGSGKLDLEKIASLRPDLIVTADWAKRSQQQVPYDKLALIAPTAVFVWEQAAGNWRDQAAATAGAVGRSAALDRLRQRVTGAAARLARTNADLFGRTRWDVIDAFKSGWDLYSAASSHGGVLTDAGVRLGAGARQQDGYKQYSFERLDLLAHSDVIVTTPGSLPVLQGQATFKRLPAARAGRVYTTDLFFPASYGIAAGLLEDLGSICTRATTA